MNPKTLTLLFITGVTQCAVSLAAWAESDRETPVVTEPARFDVVSDDPVAHGKRLSAVLGCIGCHKLDLAGEDWTEPDLGVLWTANLTHSATEFSEAELVSMIVEGKRPDRALMDMPSFLFSEVHPEDIAALVSYLKTLEVKGEKHPEPTIGPQLAKDIASGEFRYSPQQVADKKGQWPPDVGPEHAFARHITRATCVECHGMDLRGSSEPMADAPMRPNLRMVLAYSEADFTTFMRTGKALGDRDLKLMSSVARWRYSQFTDNEIKAVYDYLVELSRRDP